MEVKLGQIINAKETIEELYKDLSETKIKAKIAWRFLSLIKAIEEPINRFGKIKEELIKKYGEEKNGNIVVEKDSKNFEKFVKEFQEIGEEVINIDVKKVSIEDIAEVEINLDKLYAIEWFFEE